MLLITISCLPKCNPSCVAAHVSWWITIPAIVGLAVEIVVAATSQINSPVVPFFSIFVVIWGVCMLEYWKRQERFIALESGMLLYEEREGYRSQFVPDQTLNLSGHDLLYFSEAKRMNLETQSYVIVFVCCCFAVGTTACIYVIQKTIASASEKGYAAAPYIASILNSIQVQAYGYLYSKISSFLTDRENHRYVFLLNPTQSSFVVECCC